MFIYLCIYIHYIYGYTTKTNSGNKLCGNCSFPQNFHTRKLGEIKVFFVVLKVNTVLILEVALQL